MPGQCAAGCGGRQRSGPTGGAAYGMPRYSSSAPAVFPRTWPSARRTTSGETERCGRAAAAGPAHAAVAAASTPAASKAAPRRAAARPRFRLTGMAAPFSMRGRIVTHSASPRRSDLLRICIRYYLAAPRLSSCSWDVKCLGSVRSAMTTMSSSGCQTRHAAVQAGNIAAWYRPARRGSRLRQPAAAVQLHPRHRLGSVRRRCRPAAAADAAAGGRAAGGDVAAAARAAARDHRRDARRPAYHQHHLLRPARRAAGVGTALPADAGDHAGPARSSGRQAGRRTRRVRQPDPGSAADRPDRRLSAVLLRRLVGCGTRGRRAGRGCLPDVAGHHGGRGGRHRRHAVACRHASAGS